MKTLTPPATTEPSPSQHTVQTASSGEPAALVKRPRWRLAVAGAALSVAGLGACSSDASSTSPAASASSAATPGTAVPTSTAPLTTPTPSTTTAARADKTVKVEIKDAVLGHVVTATKVSRSIPWPAGNPVAAATYEIVGVQLTVDAGNRYSAEVKSAMFTLKPGAAAAIAPTSEFGKTLGAPLDTTKRAEKKTGWLFFKVDRGSSGALQLTLNRPAYTVKTTGTSIKAAAFSKPIG